MDFSAARRGFSLTVEHPAERMAFRILAVALMVLGCGYLYCVGASVLNVIARKEALRETASLATAVSKLESQYFAESKGVTPESGARLGLTPVSGADYVYRTGNLTAVQAGATSADTIRPNEI